MFQGVFNNPEEIFLHFIFFQDVVLQNHAEVMQTVVTIVAMIETHAYGVANALMKVANMMTHHLI